MTLILYHMYAWVKRRGEANSKMPTLNIMFTVPLLWSVSDIWATDTLYLLGSEIYVCLVRKSWPCSHFFGNKSDAGFIRELLYSQEYRFSLCWINYNSTKNKRDILIDIFYNKSFHKVKLDFYNYIFTVLNVVKKMLFFF